MPHTRSVYLKPYLQDADFTLYHGDALGVVYELQPASVDAIVTSPPYGDARPDVITISLDNFHDWLSPILVGLKRVLKPNGSLMLNLGRLFRDGEEHDYADRTVARARELGWKKIDTLVWHKLNANSAGGPYLHNVHEYVHWLALSPHAYRGFDADTRSPYAEETVGRYQRTFLNSFKFHERQSHTRELHPDGAKPKSVFQCSVGKEKGNPHPSPMALELARHLVALSCPPGGTVLDPFLGSGTTAYAARLLGRRSIGIELDARFAQMAATTMGQQSLLAGV